MGSVIGIASTRVSDTFIRQRAVSQILANQAALLRLQTQLSTGRRIQTPSEDPAAASRIISLQRLLEQKEQVQTNLRTGQSYLTATDAALSTVSDSLNEARSVALGAVSTTVSDEEREAAALQVEQTIRRMLAVGNQQFRGRYLFAGSGTTRGPFEMASSSLVQYLGDEGRLSSYSDIGALFDTNLHGSEVFGAISQPVLGTADLDPVLTFDTRLADLRGGLGITRGSIAVSDGSSTSTIDLSAAETIGDVAAMIRAGSGAIDLDVEVAPTGLKLVGAPATLLTIREVAGGSTARELGILATTPANTIVGDDLDPILRLTTRLADVLGTRSYAVVRSSGADNDIIFEADAAGAASDGIKIVFDDDGSVVVPGLDEVASYDPIARTLTVTVKTGQTQAQHLVAAVEAAYALGSVPLTARLDPLDEQNGGQGIIDVTPPGGTAGETSGGSGTAFDQGSGLQIVNGETTHVLSFADAETIEDMLNILNGSAAGVLATINENATGIDVRSRTSGADFMIGENGGTTASQLGLRSFIAETRLEDLNFGRGVADRPGTDFTITRSDGVQIDVDVSGLETVGEVLDLINGLGGGTLQARLAVYGNGIELVDQAAGSGTLTVTRTFPSMAAIDLGLIPAGQQSNTGITSGGSQTLTGSDVNTLETEGIFTALLRLYVSLKDNDVLGIQQAVGLLDQQTAVMSFSRAELGARQQGVESMQLRLESENVDLQAALSEDLDADLVKVISDYTAKQIAFEAALKSSAGTLQMTLLDYL